jgi:hypothetical protein
MKGLAIAAAVLAVAGYAFGQSYTLPQALDLMAYAAKPSMMYGVPVFRPFGWSKDGKFADILEHAIEGRGVRASAIESSTR